jgi:hypothetical protein
VSYINVPGFAGLRVEATPCSGGIALFYTGTPEQLVEAEIVPAAALVRWVRGTKRGKVDCDGDRVRVELYFGSKGGIPTPRARVILRKTLAKGLRLPGAAEAWRKFEAEKARFGPEAVVEMALARIQALSSTRH